MPKRAKTKSGARKRKSGNEIDRMAEVFIQEEKNDSSSSNSDSSSSSDSSDSDYLRKVKKLRRKDQNAKKYYKKIRRQMDTFQRNIDIKLNYMEIILQNILKAQNSQDPIEVSYDVKKPKLPAQVQALTPEPKLLSEPSSHRKRSSPITRKKLLHASASETTQSYRNSSIMNTSMTEEHIEERAIPDFPIAGIVKKTYLVIQFYNILYIFRHR